MPLHHCLLQQLLPSWPHLWFSIYFNFKFFLCYRKVFFTCCNRCVCVCVCLTGSCSPGDRERSGRGKIVSSSQLHQGRLPQTGCQGESSVHILDVCFTMSVQLYGGCLWISQNPVHYRSQSMPTRTTWPHFARSRPTKKHMCTRSLIPLTMKSLLWTRIAGRRTVWLCAHANFNTLDKETEWAVKGQVNYWLTI